MQKVGSGELSVFQKAIYSPLIKDSPAEALKQSLRYAMVKVGLRSQNWPEGEEKQLLAQHVIENFGGHRVDEIKLAFDMAIAGKLDIKPEDVRCYENFSCIYFSQIMNAYRSWSAQEYRETIKDETPPVQTILTDQQLEDIHRMDIENAYQQMRNGSVPYGLPDYFKDVLLKDKLIKEDESLANFFVQRLGKGYKNIYVPNK